MFSKYPDGQPRSSALPLSGANPVGWNTTTHVEDCQIAPECAPQCTTQRASQCAPRAPSLTGRIVEAMCDDNGRMVVMCVAKDEPEVAGNFEDGQFATDRGQVPGDRENVAEQPPTEAAEPIQNPDDDKITIVVLHPNAPGAEVSAADATPQAQPP